jgi:hypothetical protein
MQFLPGTWSHYAADGDGDGRADPQNVYDATLAAARYLCSGGLNLREQTQVMTAILRYNNSMAYAENVMGWAAAYATGVAPVDLPPIVGPAPPIADLHLEHLEHPEGLGPESFSMHGMSPVQQTAGSSLIDLGQSGAGGQSGNLPWPTPWMNSTEQQLPRPSAACRMICLEPQAEATPAAPPYAVPPATVGVAPAPFGPPEAPPVPPAPMPAYAVAPAPAAPADEPPAQGPAIAAPPAPAATSPEAPQAGPPA